MLLGDVDGTVVFAADLDPVGTARAGSGQADLPAAGVVRHALPRVLEPFVQAENATPPQEMGTGLGLPLTKSLAELHGGTFQLWSRVGFGTRAVLRLPVVAQAPDNRR